MIQNIFIRLIFTQEQVDVIENLIVKPIGGLNPRSKHKAPQKHSDTSCLQAYQSVPEILMALSFARAFESKAGQNIEPFE